MQFSCNQPNYKTLVTEQWDEGGFEKKTITTTTQIRMKKRHTK